MSLAEQLDRLASFEPAPYPVVSLYLNTQPGPQGRDQHQAFIRKEFKARSRTYPAGSPERDSLDRDLERIARYLENELQPSANAVAVFACSAGELFEAIQVAGSIEQHWLHIGDQPHLYPLARLESQYPTYAAVLADTNTARVMVFAAGDVVAVREVVGVKTRGTSGGTAQPRYQRHISNFHLHHAKEVIEALDRVVRAEGIHHILLSGDAVIMPLLRDQMPKHLAEKVVDEVRLATNAPVAEVVKVSLAAMQKVNERTDREKVDAAIGGYRAGGLGVVGAEDTLTALVAGQVDELLISANMREMQGGEVTANDTLVAEQAVDSVSAGEPAEAEPQIVRLADQLITKAKQTSARITFIEDPSLLTDYGGVAALLRFRI